MEYKMISEKANVAKQHLINEMNNHPINAKEIGAFRTLIKTAVETGLISKDVKTTGNSMDMAIIMKIANIAEYYRDSLPEVFKNE